jgi:hypothetical protein
VRAAHALRAGHIAFPSSLPFLKTRASESHPCTAQSARAAAAICLVLQSSAAPSVRPSLQDPQLSPKMPHLEGALSQVHAEPTVHRAGPEGILGFFAQARGEKRARALSECVDTCGSACRRSSSTAREWNMTSTPPAPESCPAAKTGCPRHHAWLLCLVKMLLWGPSSAQQQHSWQGKHGEPSNAE